MMIRRREIATNGTNVAAINERTTMNRVFSFMEFIFCDMENRNVLGK